MAQIKNTRLAAARGEALFDEPDFLREIIQNVLQEMLEAGMAEHLNAVPYERSEGRRGHRNGYKSRNLNTRGGALTLMVRQDRDGTFKPEMSERNQRREEGSGTGLRAA